MNSEQFTAIVKQAQVRFGCTEEQAVRLAKSFAADVGRGVKVGKVSGEKGLASLRLPGVPGVPIGVAGAPAIRLVRFLQIIEAIDKENIGLSSKGKFPLTPEMDSWLRKAPETPAEPNSPQTTATEPTG